MSAALSCLWAEAIAASMWAFSAPCRRCPSFRPRPLARALRSRARSRDAIEDSRPATRSRYARPFRARHCSGRLVTNTLKLIGAKCASVAHHLSRASRPTPRACANSSTGARASPTSAGATPATATPSTRSRSPGGRSYRTRATGADDGGKPTERSRPSPSCAPATAANASPRPCSTSTA